MSNTYFNISDKLRLYEFDGMLDQYGDAAAAYSLRKLRNGYTGNAIRVRRSSDDAEQDIGFYDNELDTVAIENFCGEDNHITYSDPSINAEANTLLYSTIALNDWGLGEPSIDNKVILDRDLGNALAYFRQEYVIPGEEYTISCYVKILDGNPPEFGSNTGQQGYLTIGGTNFSLPLDYTVTNVATDIYRISATGNAGTGTTQFGFLRWANAALGQIEVAGMQVTKGGQITDYVATRGGASGFGFVQTWYDQSANANHAVQNTDTAQPKIVDAGTLVTGGGKPTILYDDVDDVLELTSEIVTTDAFRHFIVCDNDADGRVYDSAGQPDNLLIQSYRYILRVNNTNITINSNTGRDKNIIEAGRDSSDAVDFVVNDSTLSSGTVISGQSKLAQIGSSTSHYGGTIYEVITYNSDATISSLDISGIRGNINTHYSIY